MSQLIDLSESKILASLSLIERYIPRKKEWTLYEASSDFDPKDIVSVQKEARKMMDFVGLKEYTTLVTYESCEEGTAGNINLNKELVVYININKGLFVRPRYKDAILGTLAHEICHKLLYVNGLYLTNTTANEITTDLCTIYIGFGLLTVNGCKDSKTTEKKDELGNTTITTNTYSTGYLTPRAYFFALYIMCYTYKFPFEIIKKRLALSVFPDYNNTNCITIPDITKESLKNEFKQQNREVAAIKRDIIVLQSILDILSMKMQPFYQQMDNRFNRLLFSDDITQMPIAALYATLGESETKDSVTEIQSISKKLDEFISTYCREDVEQFNKDTLFATCPFCGSKSSSPLSDHKKSILKCKCGKIYYWDASIREVSSTPVDIRSSKGRTETNNNKSSNSIWCRIRKLFS